MADTEIEWATKVYNFTRGCRRVSAGCGGANGQGGCYAEKTAYRFSGPGMPYEGLVRLGKHGPQWTGKGRFVPEKLAEPMSWRVPRDGSRHRIFVDSMSDLFFEEFSNEEIAAGFGVMAACPQHDFLILTKRPERAAEWFKWAHDQRCHGNTTAEVMRSWAIELGRFRADDGSMPKGPGRELLGFDDRWPLPTVWIGTSVEDQATAEERIPLLLQCPAAVHFVSYEPALGPVDFALWMNSVPSFTAACARALGEISHQEMDAGIERFKRARGTVPDDARLRWIIAGGESGNGARPFDPLWARAVIELGRLTGTPVFCKQLGANVFAPWKVEWAEQPNGVLEAFALDRASKKAELATVYPNGVWHTWDARGTGGENASEPTVEKAKQAALEALQRQHINPVKGWARHAHMLRHKKGSDMAEWPVELRVREFPKSAE